MNSKNIKKIVTAALLLVLIIVGIANIRFKSVSDYENEQQSIKEQIIGTQPSTQITSEQSETQVSERTTESEMTTVASSQIQPTTEATSKPTTEATTPTAVQTQQETQTQQVTQAQLVTCSIAIDCSTLSNNTAALENANLIQHVPANGVILSQTTIQLPKGSTAYDALNQACKAFNIQMESKFTPIYNTYYVEGINYLYEKNAGNMSGWIYKVNGKTASVGASAYKLKEGDKITWHYTIDGGKDVS